MANNVDIEALAAQMFEDDNLGEWESASSKLRAQYMDAAEEELDSADLSIMGTLDNDADIDEATRKANAAMFADLHKYVGM